MVEYHGYYITSTADVGENMGGRFYQIYSDKDFNNEVDNFCLSREQLADEDKLVKQYVDELIEERDKMKVYGLFVKQDKELIMLVLFKDIEVARERLALIKRADEKATAHPDLYTADLDTADHYRERYKTDRTTKHLLAVRFEVYIEALPVEGWESQ